MKLDAKDVVETGSFVLPRTAAEAVLSLGGGTMRLAADASAAAGSSAVVDNADGSTTLKFGRLSGDDSLRMDMTWTPGQVQYKLYFVISVVDGPLGHDHTVIYTLTK